MLTKALDGPKHKDNRQRIGLLPKTGVRTGLSAFLEGELRDEVSAALCRSGTDWIVHAVSQLSRWPTS